MDAVISETFTAIGKTVKKEGKDGTIPFPFAERLFCSLLLLYAIDLRLIQADPTRWEI